MGAASSVAAVAAEPVLPGSSHDVSIEMYGLAAFELLSKIGHGAFGVVWKAQRKSDDEFVAIKVQDKDQILLRGQSSRVIAERNIMTQIRHPFIVRLHAAFQNHEHLYLVLTYAEGGDVAHALARRKHSRFERREARLYAAEVTLALAHLHVNNIVFRDLKPENILLAGDGHILLADFGLAKNVKTDRAMTVCGTPEFMAPEQWHADRAVTEQADMWSLGCLIYLMLVGKTPFYDAEKHTYDRAKALVGSFPPPPADLCCDDARSAIADLLHLSPAKRATSAQHKDCAWYSDLDWRAVLAKKDPVPTVPESELKSGEVPELKRESSFDKFIRHEAKAPCGTEPQLRSRFSGDSFRNLRRHDNSRGDEKAARNVVAAYVAVLRLSDLRKARSAAVVAWCGLRSVGSASRKLWAQLIADEFVYTHPVTPYRFQTISETSFCGSIKILAGIDAFIADMVAGEKCAASSDKAVSFSALGVQPFANVVLAYEVLAEDIVSAPDASRVAFMCTLRELTHGASTIAMGEMTFRGDRILEMTMTLDVLGFSKHIGSTFNARHDAPRPMPVPMRALDLGIRTTGPCDYVFLKKLGQGAFGKVWHAREHATGLAVAIKTLDKGFLQVTGLWRHAAMETAVLGAVQHPFIVELKSTFYDSVKLYIVLELVTGGTLTTLLEEQADCRLPVRAVRYLGAQACDALTYLHDNDITYRDLKPDNILITARGDAQLTDFGCVAVRGDLGARFAARAYDYDGEGSRGRRASAQEVYDASKPMQTLCGSPLYMAPEMLRGGTYGPEVDHWAYGVLLFVMASNSHPCGGDPTDGDSQFHVIRATLAGQVQRLDVSTVAGGGDGPSGRGGAEALADMCSRLLVADPARRLGSGPGMISDHSFFAGLDWNALRCNELPPVVAPKMLSDSAPTARASQDAFGDFAHYDCNLPWTDDSTSPDRAREDSLGLGKLADSIAGARSQTKRQRSLSNGEGKDSAEAETPSKLFAKRPVSPAVSHHSMSSSSSAESLCDVDAPKPTFTRVVRDARRPSFLRHCSGVVRTQVLARFCALRTACCVDRAEWNSCVDNLCVQSAPRCPYRQHFEEPSNEAFVESSQRVFLVGVDDMIRDCAMARDAGSDARRQGFLTGNLVYKLDSVIHDDDDTASFFKWTMWSELYSVGQSGGGRVRFSNSGLIKTIDLVHDVHGFMEKLLRSDPTTFSRNPAIVRIAASGNKFTLQALARGGDVAVKTDGKNTADALPESPRSPRSPPPSPRKAPTSRHASPSKLARAPPASPRLPRLAGAS